MMFSTWPRINMSCFKLQKSVFGSMVAPSIRNGQNCKFLLHFRNFKYRAIRLLQLKNWTMFSVLDRVKLFFIVFRRWRHHKMNKIITLNNSLIFRTSSFASRGQNLPSNEKHRSAFLVPISVRNLSRTEDLGKSAFEVFLESGLSTKITIQSCGTPHFFNVVIQLIISSFVLFL